MKGKGYTVTGVSLEVGNDKNYTLHKISLSLNKDEEIESQEESANIEADRVQAVNEIRISVSSTQMSGNESKEEKPKSNLNNSEKRKIKEYLSSVYEINEKNIVIE